MRLINCYMKPYIQPFERHLALKELEALGRTQPTPIDGSPRLASVFSIATASDPQRLISRLAYWECVEDGFRFFTRQIRAEATFNVVRNGIPFEEIRRHLPFNGSIPLPNRRCLRYGTHGIHEYRGKFFPQLASALLNIAGLGSRHHVLDPMCGSGTALVEAIRAGCSAYGLDLNPLSALMSRTKCELLSVQPESVIRSYNNIREYLLESNARSDSPLHYFRTLPESDQDYLSKWFSAQVIEGLDRIASYIDARRPTPVRSLMWLSLSNILRRASCQKDDDLRVRREVRLDAEIDPIREFLEELGRSVRLLVSFLYEHGRDGAGPHVIHEGDARAIDGHFADIRGKVDAVITSPPYATALPYLDTDRLSLLYLKLLRRGLHRERDQQMIGNREITNGTRDAYWKEFCLSKRAYPAKIFNLIERIDHLNQDTTAGFRRRNLPALLSKYFSDMKRVLEKVYGMLKPGSTAFIVVGNNHTIAGGQRVDIKTAALLFELGSAVGFKQKEMLSMEMLVSRDIFKKNASDSEFILFLERPVQR